MVALHDTKNEILESFDFSKHSTEQLFAYLIKNKNEITSLNAENPHALFGVGAKSTFSFGRSVGVLETIIRLSGVPYRLLPPKEWQKPLFIGFTKKMKAKEKSKIIFSRLFPQYRDMKINDGLIDAALIALYKV